MACQVRWCQLLALSLVFWAWEGPAEVRYRVVQLVTNQEIGALDSATWAGGINRFGDVCGYYTVDRGTNSVNYPYPYESKPFVYKDANGMLPLVGTSIRFSGFSSGINNRGQVAFWGTPDNMHSLAYRYTPGVGVEALGSISDGSGDVATAINNLGQVVGRSDAYRGNTPWEYGFLYTDEIGVTNIGSLNENAYSAAYDINDLGQVTGISGGYVFLYTPQTGMVSIGQGVGYGINSQGIVAGRVGWGPPYNAALYVNGTTRLLTSPDVDSEAYDINDHNVIVGQIFSGEWEIFVWTERDGMMGLNSLIEPGWHVLWPSGINEFGQIAAEGNFVPPDVATFAVRLDPIPPKLIAQRASTNLVVTWNPAWPGVVLESSGDLSASSWRPMATGGTNVVTLPIASGARFFRLNLEALRGLCCPPQ